MYSLIVMLQLPSICCPVDNGWNSSSLRPTPNRFATQESSSVSSFHRIYGIDLGWHSNHFLDSFVFLGDTILLGPAAAICWAVLVRLSLPVRTFTRSNLLILYLLSTSIFFAFLLVMSLTMKTWFRMLASAFKSPAPAQSLAGISLLVLILYTGFTIPQPSIIGALRWITYLNVGLSTYVHHSLLADCQAVAITLRVWKRHDKRIPYTQWCLCDIGSFGTWLFEHHHSQPGLHLGG